jgi:hypothetical protein
MTIRNHPGSYGVLAGLLVLLLAAVANAGCQHPQEPIEPTLEPTRPQAQRAESAVEIYTECGSGTGVLVNGTQVLTASHVVNCAEWPEMQAAKYIAVRTLDKQTSIAMVDINDGERDLARLTLQTRVAGIWPVSIRMAVEGETICAATARPERAFRCGTVDGFRGPRSWGDVIIKGANIWYGNSGSGVYGADGALIGIAVRLSWCSPGDALLAALTDERMVTCGGRVSSISDSKVMM